MGDADVILEKLACDLERRCFSDARGILAKKKRDREDAQLRADVRLEQRVELANRIRSYKSGNGNDIDKLLLEVEKGEANENFTWGPNVAAAVLGQLLVVEISVVMDAHMRNCEPKFALSLTDEGRKRVTSKEE